MYASVIGQTFLQAFNKRQGTTHTAKSFFSEVFHPLFYNHDKYLQWVINSPLVNPFPKTGEARIQQLLKLQEKIVAVEPDGSFAIGYPAAEEKEYATTSGQVTNLSLQAEEDLIYASWIGNGFGIRVSGGLCLLINEPQLLLELFYGWQYYRNNYLNNKSYPNLKGNQVEAWNGQWLVHRFGAKLVQVNNWQLEQKAFDEGMNQVNTAHWPKVLFALSRLFKGDAVSAYVYAFSQMNTTIGFVALHLAEAKKALTLYQEIFGKNDYLNNAPLIENMYGGHFSFHKACQFGAIGLRALEPADFRSLFEKPTIRKPKSEEDQHLQEVQIKVFKTWILAMLNNKELHEEAKLLVQHLTAYETSKDKGISTKRSNEVEKIISSAKPELFITALAAIAEDFPQPQALRRIVEQLTRLPEDRVKYLIALLKFEHALQKNQNLA